MAIRFVRFPWDPLGFRWYRQLGIRRIAGGLVVQWSQWSLYLAWKGQNA